MSLVLKNNNNHVLMIDNLSEEELAKIQKKKNKLGLSWDELIRRFLV